MIRPSRCSVVGSSFAICAFVFLTWAYAIYMRAPAVGTFHDDGVYLVTAKALATGHGYRVVSLPGEPRQTKYPVLFPWVLSLVWRAYPVFPENLFWLRLVPLSAGAVWLYLSWRLLRRLGTTPAIATAAVLLAAISPWTLFLSTTLLSETLFAALVTGGLLTLMRIGSNTGRQYDAVIAGALLGAAMLARTAGLVIVVAGLAAFATRRQWRAAAAYLITAAAVSGGWFVWAARHASEPIVDPFYSASSYASGHILSNYSWPDKLAVLGVNTLWATQFGQFWGLAVGSLPAWIAMAVGSTLAVRGAWIARASPASIVCGGYVASLLAWAFPPIRYMVPVLPMLVWFVFVGAGRLKVPLGVLAIALALFSGAAVWRLVTTTQAKGGTWFDAGLVDDWHAMRTQYDWIGRNTPADAVFIATHDPTCYLFTGRKALRPSTPDTIRLYYNVRQTAPRLVEDVGALRQRILDIDASYIIVTPRDDVAVLEAMKARFPGSLAVVQRSSSPGYFIYRIDRRGLLSD